MNEFTKQDEIIFISYDEVIKNPYPFILKQILSRYRTVYEDFIDFSKIEDLDDKNMLRFCVQRHEKNIFTMLAKKEFDYNKALKDIYNKFDDMFIDLPTLSIARSMFFLLNQKFTKRIYIHTEEYDKRIHLDIHTNFKNMEKVKYVTGPIYDVFEQLEGITSYIFNDIMDVATLLAFDKKCEYTNILVGNFGYNYTLNEENKLVLKLNLEDISKEKIFKFATFTPVNFTEEYFTKI